MILATRMEVGAIIMLKKVMPRKRKKPPRTKVLATIYNSLKTITLALRLEDFVVFFGYLFLCMLRAREKVLMLFLALESLKACILYIKKIGG